MEHTEQERQQRKEAKMRYWKKIFDQAPMVDCACGCGEKIKNKDLYGRDKKFVSGHNGRKYEDPEEYKRVYQRKRKALKNGSFQQPSPKRRAWTEKEIKYLKDTYPKVGWKKASIDLKRSGESIMSMAKCFGIKSEVHNELVCISRSNNCVDQHFFDILKGYNRGYILGFILADGSSSGDNVVIVEIKDTDEEILQFIKDQMKLTCKISYRKNRSMAHISIPTKQMNNRLRDLGVVTNKSSVVSFPEGGDDEFNRGVVAGYFDGDGSICWNKKGQYKKIILNFTSNSLKMLDQISSLIADKVFIEKKNVTSNKLSYSCNKAMLVAEWIYGDLSDEEFHMTRKKNRFTEAKLLMTKNLTVKKVIESE